MRQRVEDGKCPSWMKGFIPQLDKRNSNVSDEAREAVEAAQAAKAVFLDACERVRETLNPLKR